MVNSRNILIAFIAGVLFTACTVKEQPKNSFLTYMGGKPEKLRIDTISVERLTRILPRSLFQKEEDGIIVFQVDDTVYYHNSTTVSLVRAKGLNPVIVCEHEGHNTFYAIKNGLLTEGTLLDGDSMVAFLWKGNIVFESYTSDLGPKIQLIHVNPQMKMEYHSLVYKDPEIKGYEIYLVNNEIETKLKQ
jgi:hypothetical protein